MNIRFSIMGYNENVLEKAPTGAHAFREPSPGARLCAFGQGESIRRTRRNCDLWMDQRTKREGSLAMEIISLRSTGRTVKDCCTEKQSNLWRYVYLLMNKLTFFPFALFTFLRMQIYSDGEPTTDNEDTAIANTSFNFISLPAIDIALWRTIFRKAGAYIYWDDGDLIYSGNGILSIHTAGGGNRSVVLKNGMTTQMTSNRLRPLCLTARREKF